MRWSRYRWRIGTEAYEEGVDAALAGKSVDANPYRERSRNWICWRVGWFGYC